MAANKPSESYDRVTFYRLRDQVGTEAEPAQEKRELNLAAFGPDLAQADSRLGVASSSSPGSGDKFGNRLADTAQKGALGMAGEAGGKSVVTAATAGVPQRTMRLADISRDGDIVLHEASFRIQRAGRSKLDLEQGFLIRSFA